MTIDHAQHIVCIHISALSFAIFSTLENCRQPMHMAQAHAVYFFEMQMVEAPKTSIRKRATINHTLFAAAATATQQTRFQTPLFEFECSLISSKEECNVVGDGFIAFSDAFYWFRAHSICWFYVAISVSHDLVLHARYRVHQIEWIEETEVWTSYIAAYHTNFSANRILKWFASCALAPNRCALAL